MTIPNPQNYLATVTWNDIYKSPSTSHLSLSPFESEVFRESAKLAANVKLVAIKAETVSVEPNEVLLYRLIELEEKMWLALTLFKTSYGTSSANSRARNLLSASNPHSELIEPGTECYHSRNAASFPPRIEKESAISPKLILEANLVDHLFLSTGIQYASSGNLRDDTTYKPTLQGGLISWGYRIKLGYSGKDADERTNMLRR
ncbi:uncharacterized protein EV420DRAFT_1474401 [Desarmillaria tabescens]|uniref:Uncharacterized protein n=1 Tax=Armillaria tabescens TaxID=1929756 RepID=A0AA39U4R2_ARMTA|nr:uncharacterized protein EV420DRAFT_1474401 [Desarmillaria tabescens]KAK0466995.1 hypothetical protein EV420DRAFT_1474401 [Desarmillaria tabescens]